MPAIYAVTGRLKAPRAPFGDLHESDSTLTLHLHSKGIRKLTIKGGKINNVSHYYALSIL